MAAAEAAGRLPVPVTAWTTEVQDEHRLLGAVLARCSDERRDRRASTSRARTRRPAAPDAIAAASPEVDGTPDLWQALGGKLKPGLDL